MILEHWIHHPGNAPTERHTIASLPCWGATQKILHGLMLRTEGKMREKQTNNTYFDLGWPSRHGLHHHLCWPVSGDVDPIPRILQLPHVPG